MNYLCGILITIFLLFTPLAKEANAAFKGTISDCLAVKPDGHTATLTIDTNRKVKPVGNKKTYIFACMSGGDMGGTKCTTGSSKSDIEAFGKDTDLKFILDLVKKQQEGSFFIGKVGGKNPVTTNAAGTALNEIVKWADSYHPASTHQFSWLQEAVPVSIGKVPTGSKGALQNATFNFEQAKKTASSKCVKILWDPRGYVFDAATLNPVKGVTVTLSKGPKGGVFTDVPTALGATNPDITRALNGQFSFLVAPGYYKLRVASPTIIEKIDKVNQEYVNLFCKNDMNGNCVSEEREKYIYQEGEEILEVAGAVAVRHIPVTGVGADQILTTLQTIEQDKPETVNGNIRISGAVSHPKSKIILTTNMLNEEGVPKDIVRVEYTDDLGEYDIADISQVIEDPETPEGEPTRYLTYQNLKVEFELNSFYTTGTFSIAKKDNKEKSLSFFENIFRIFNPKVPTVFAESNTSYNVKPIPTYIEGIAYDEKGLPIPNALIGAYPFYSEIPMYVTVADENGRYKIGSQHLPQVEYTLRYKKPTGETLTVDTGAFIKQNITFFKEEGIKPFASVDSSLAEDAANEELVKKTTKGADVAAVFSSTAGISGNNTGTTTYVNPREIPRSIRATEKTTPPQISTSSSSGIIMIVVVIFVLLLTGVGAFIMMKSRQSHP